MADDRLKNLIDETEYYKDMKPNYIEYDCDVTITGMIAPVPAESLEIAAYYTNQLDKPVMPIPVNFKKCIEFNSEKDYNVFAHHILNDDISITQSTLVKLDMLPCYGLTIEKHTVFLTTW